MMIQHGLLVLSTLLGAAGAQPMQPAPSVSEALAPSDYEALLDEFELAEQRHIETLEQTEDRQERMRLRKQHPAYSFYPRFAALAQAGEGEAYLWLIPNTRYCGEPRAAERGIQARQVREMFSRHCADAWFEQAIPLLNKARREIGEEEQAALLRSVTECSELDDVRAAAGFTLAQLLLRSKDAERQSEGLAWYEQVITRWPDTRYASMAQPAYNRARFLRVGGEPLEFTAKTVDGEPFQLSDFRGKVVVLDFWGFW